MVYSDIGAYTLGRMLEKVTGQTLDAYLHSHVFEPAGMHDTQYKPPASLLPRIAPTEVDPKRGGLVRGKVHDERAYYLGGVSAHAGLFSTAHDLTRFAQMYLNHGVSDGISTADSFGAYEGTSPACLPFRFALPAASPGSHDRALVDRIKKS